MKHSNYKCEYWFYVLFCFVTQQKSYTWNNSENHMVAEVRIWIKENIIPTVSYQLQSQNYIVSDAFYIIIL